MSHCESNSILAHYPPGIKLNPLKCKRWTCDECKHSRCARLRKEAFRGEPNTFITLTVNPSWGTGRDHRARSLKDAWTRIHRKAKKFQHKKKLEYLCVFEETKQGEPHLHILCRSDWIDQAWLSEQMLEEMDAPIVDIRRVHNKKKAASYVSKYVSKSPEKFPGTKRYWRSQDYFCHPKEPWVDPLGEATKREFAQGLPAYIKEQYIPELWEYQEMDLPEGKEYWLMFKRPSFLREDKPPPEKALDLFGSASPGASAWRGEIGD